MLTLADIRQLSPEYLEVVLADAERRYGGDKTLLSFFTSPLAVEDTAGMKAIDLLCRRLVHNIDTYVCHSHHETDESTNLVIHTGNDCNFHCAHCLIGSPGMSPSLDRFDLGLLRPALKEGRIRSVTFTGGEPFLNTALLEAACLQIKSEVSDMPISVITNGSLLTAALFDRFEGLINALNLSYDRFHQEGGHPVDVTTLAKLALSRGLEFTLVSVVSYIEDLTALRRFPDLTHTINVVRPYGALALSNPPLTSDQLQNCMAMRRVPAFSAVYYLPGLGFSPCYSLEYLQPSLVVDTPGSIPPFFAGLSSPTWGDIARRAGISPDTRWHSACELCRHIARQQYA